MGGYLSGGYPSSVDITYGLDIAYICQTNNPHFLKIGLDIGRFKMGKYENDVELDAILEDEFQEYFKPYFEWRWDLSGFIGLFTQAGYRFLRSETEKVTEILSRYDNGRVRAFRTSDHTRFYGSDFELGVGLSINVY